MKILCKIDSTEKLKDVEARKKEEQKPLLERADWITKQTEALHKESDEMAARYWDKLKETLVAEGFANTEELSGNVIEIAEDGHIVLFTMQEAFSRKIAGTMPSGLIEHLLK